MANYPTQFPVLACSNESYDVSHTDSWENIENEEHFDQGEISGGADALLCLNFVNCIRPDSDGFE